VLGNVITDTLQHEKMRGNVIIGTL